MPSSATETQFTKAPNKVVEKCGYKISIHTVLGCQTQVYGINLRNEFTHTLKEINLKEIKIHNTNKSIFRFIKFCVYSIAIFLDNDKHVVCDKCAAIRLVYACVKIIRNNKLPTLMS